MAVSFRDRFFTPPVARAITSPTGILLAGAGTALGILAGLGPAAAVLGAAAWAVRVAVAVPRRPAGDRIDPFTLAEPWRQFVQNAQAAQRRFHATVRADEAGPIRDRLLGIGARVDDGVRECWKVARLGHELDRGLQGLDPRRVAQEYELIEAELRRSPSDSLERTRQSIRAQLDSAARIQQTSEDARNRLRVLTAQLNESVARAIELSLQTGSISTYTPVSDDVDHVVHEMEVLRQALEETSGMTRGTPGAAAGGTA